MGSGIRLDDTSRLCHLLAMMGRRGNKYADLAKLADDQIPLFFHALHEFHTKFPVATILADADVSPT